jgi:prolyl-tRNA synthetase
VRLSNLFGRTLREPPAEAGLVSHRLLLRAAMVRSSGPALYTYLPLGWRVMGKIKTLVRREMEAIGAQEMLLPLAQPAEPRSEDCLVDLLRREVSSYRQLPLVLYNFQTAFHDEPRLAGGLMQAGQSLVQEVYSCHADDDAGDDLYAQVANVFARCALEVLAVEAGAAAVQFVALSDKGDDSFIVCSACGYAANVEYATFDKGQKPDVPLLTVEEVATPDCTTIEAVAKYVGVPTAQTLKAVFFVTDSGELIFALLRGDLEVNEAKLSRLLGGQEIYPAPWQALQEAGLVGGYASPAGARGKAKVIVDGSARLGANFVAGANREGYHLKNVNYPRDFQADLETDIALARAGDPCPRCGAPLTVRRGFELAYLRKPEKQRAEVTYLDREGQPQPITLGTYRLALSRLLAAIVEQHHDEQGIVWPASLAPYQAHLLLLGADEELRAQAETLYADLQEQGWEVLYDDRDESAGTKFADADLIGCPLRLTVSKRSHKAGGVELKLRAGESAEVVPLNELAARIASEIRR